MHLLMVKINYKIRKVDSPYIRRAEKQLFQKQNSSVGVYSCSRKIRKNLTTNYKKVFLSTVDSGINTYGLHISTPRRLFYISPKRGRPWKPRRIVGVGTALLSCHLPTGLVWVMFPEIRSDFADKLDVDKRSGCLIAMVFNDKKFK